MDSKTEPASEAKERIEREALKKYTNRADNGLIFPDYNASRRFAYIDGAIAEYNRAQEEITLLKAELERERELRKSLKSIIKLGLKN